MSAETVSKFLCDLENKEVVFTFDKGMSMSLGQNVAGCHYKHVSKEGFEPLENPSHLQICFKACRIFRLNSEIEKIATDKMKSINKSDIRIMERLAIRDGKKSIALKEGDML